MIEGRHGSLGRMTNAKDLAARIKALDWSGVTSELETAGAAPVGVVLSGKECADLAGLYAEEARFRSRIVMARHGFGSGEYQYFANPIPEPIAAMRTAFYPHLAAIANRWAAALGATETFPDTLDAMLARCHAAGQTRPTPLMLKYGPGDYNCLHQDLYGPNVFPLQVVILLSDPAKDFSVGEFVVVEQRPRMQSKAEVVAMRQGEAVVFATHHRPKQGTKGIYRVNLRHGVSRVRSGTRQTLGLIFHDAA